MENTMDMHLPGKFDAKKQSLKILRNSKTAFNFSIDMVRFT